VGEVYLLKYRVILPSDMAFKVVTRDFEVESSHENEMLDITDRVQKAVAASGLSDGLMTVFVVGSTAAITTIEYDLGLIKDFPRTLERVAPKDAGYEHQKTWHDGNGHSHVKASLVGPSLTVPLVAGDLVLGEWQQIVLIEFDIRPRTRKVVVQVVGE
jgi:secondary thiamine-phosphate synthase enzyme